MKKYVLLAICALLLSGCGAQQTFETISDDHAAAAMATASQVHLSLPEEAALPSGEGEDGSKLYLCDGFAVTVQTLDSADIDQTFRQVTGFSKDDLTVMQTQEKGNIVYRCAWCAAGEAEDQVCRSVILDDGEFHYAVTVMVDYSQAGELRDTWQAVLDSVMLSTD